MQRDAVGPFYSATRPGKKLAQKSIPWNERLLTTNGVIDCLSGPFNPAALWIHADKGGFPMSAAVGGRDDYDALPLRGLSRTSEDLRQARRLLSLACVYDGMSRADAAKGGGVARQSLRDRGHRFNEARPEGAEGAVRPPGPAAPMAELAEIIEPGPCLEHDA